MYPHPFIFNPTPVPKRFGSLRLWLNPDDASTHQTSGGLVDRLFDASGHGNHAVKTIDDDRPTIGLLNGRKILSFAFGDKMTGTTLLTGDVDFTIFCVARKGSDASESNAYFVIGADKSYGLSVAATAFTRPGFLNGGLAWHAEPLGLTNGSVVRQTLRRTNNTTYYERGVTETITNIASPVAAPYGVYTLGRHSSANQVTDICELAFFTEYLPDPYMAEMNKYLNDRWGTV